MFLRYPKISRRQFSSLSWKIIFCFGPSIVSCVLPNDKISKFFYVVRTWGYVVPIWIKSQEPVIMFAKQNYGMLASIDVTNCNLVVKVEPFYRILNLPLCDCPNIQFRTFANRVQNDF